MTAPTYETDPRPFPEVLREWMRVNGYTRKEAAETLGVKFETFKDMLYKDSVSPCETSLRKLMTALEDLKPG